MKSLLQAVSFSTLFLFASSGYCTEPYRVVFETIDCSGNTGFSTIAPENIYKIESGDCAHPDNPGQKLKKMLVHDGQGSYLLFSVSEQEARNVMNDVKDYMKARKDVLERANTIITTQ